jgi:HK97 family phage prohead protease
MLFAHGQSVPVGRWEMFEQRGKKLVAHGTLLISVTKATEVYAMPKNRILDGQSVGFLSPGRCGMGRGESDRRITKGTLMEVSLVAIAADAGARIIEVKRIDVERVTWRIDELNREWRDENIAQLTQFAGTLDDAIARLEQVAERARSSTADGEIHDAQLRLVQAWVAGRSGLQ